MQTKYNMQHIQHFFWDFDGTLFDSYPIIIDVLRAALRDYGHDCDPVEAMSLMLDNIDRAHTYYASKFGIDKSDFINTYTKHHQAINPQLLAKPMADVEKVLSRICEKGGYNYIFTHRKWSTTVQYLEKYGLSRYFRDVIGTESEGFAYKPSPDALLYLMNKYDIPAEAAAMVGDRDCDLGSARNAGIGTVHYVCAAVPETLSCDFRFENYKEMLAHL